MPALDKNQQRVEFVNSIWVSLYRPIFNSDLFRPISSARYLNIGFRNIINRICGIYVNSIEDLIKIILNPSLKLGPNYCYLKNIHSYNQFPTQYSTKLPDPITITPFKIPDGMREVIEQATPHNYVLWEPIPEPEPIPQIQPVLNLEGLDQFNDFEPPPTPPPPQPISFGMSTSNWDDNDPDVYF
jgi:hypothetical protein